MKYDHREVSELSDEELLSAYWNHLEAEHNRTEAAKHPKFKKMEFPPINPEFVKLKEALKAELDNRKPKV